MMDNLVAKAEYILALSTNNMTDEVRNNYYNSFGEDSNYLIIFAEILQIIMKQFKTKNLTKENAIEVAKNEFAKLSLADFIVNKEEIYPLIDILFEERTKEDPITLELLKRYIDIADKINNYSIVYAIYYGILNGLLLGEIVDKDLEFSEKVISFIKNGEKINSYDSLLINVLMEAIAHVD